jgi:hypothetical protein
MLMDEAFFLEQERGNYRLLYIISDNFLDLQMNETCDVYSSEGCTRLISFFPK